MGKAQARSTEWSELNVQFSKVARRDEGVRITDFWEKPAAPLLRNEVKKQLVAT
jgi:hypothetical protein